MKPTSAYQRQPSSAPALPGPIIEADWLATQQRASAAVRIVDLRDRMSYDEGHLPGAVWLDRTALSSTRPDHSVTLVPAALFAALIGRLGITAGMPVVAYDDVWGMHAARLVWALWRYGHPQAAVLSGGAESWLQAGRTLTRGALLTYPQPFAVASDGAQRADMLWLAAHQGDRQLLLLDVRGAHEYAAGHLPGARHWEWSIATPVGSWAMLRPADELRAELQAAGITLERRIVTYCSSGSRAAHTYLLLRSLGYPEVRVLDDAWRARLWERRTL
jgi:thiosulfate/3-mercaptopyruvate sulfurtransferase